MLLIQCAQSVWALSTSSCLDLEIAGCPLEVGVALLVGAAGAEAYAGKGGPGSALEQDDGEDDAEAQAEGGLDEEVREAAVPLYKTTFVRTKSQNTKKTKSRWGVFQVEVIRLVGGFLRCR